MRITGEGGSAWLYNTGTEGTVLRGPEVRQYEARGGVPAREFTSCEVRFPEGTAWVRADRLKRVD